MLDGNAAAGVLREVFAADMTMAFTSCAGCGTTYQLGELRLFASAMGMILRCPSCDMAMLRVGNIPNGYWLDLRGVQVIKVARA
ncbi:MAG: hypothetical protein H7Y32_11395 [Chloroflexales bacterium]|nr:hypothetical protein [Chloroflexales bacterium]